jgi:hypothetical protein
MSYNMLNPEINTATADIKAETDLYLKRIIRLHIVREEVIAA